MWLCTTTGIHVHYNQRMGYITQSKNNSNDIDQKHSNCKNISDKHCVLLVYVSLCKLQSLPFVYFDFSWSFDCLISHLSSFAVPQDSPSVTAKVKECRNARRIIKKIEKFIFYHKLVSSRYLVPVWLHLPSNTEELNISPITALKVLDSYFY